MASIDVSIAAYYAPERAGFLGEVLTAIAGWRQHDVRITIDTNDLALKDEAVLQEPLTLLRERDFAITFDQATGMAHPFHLTWWHKRRLREWAAGGGNQTDLFVYIEDDMVLSADNIDYFIAARSSLAGTPLIPGFIRYEADPDGKATSVDFRQLQLIDKTDFILVDDYRFIAPEAPYWAGFILDRSLCGEYLASPWSQLRSAETMPQSKGHTCRVQSAWALTYENVPAGLPSRCVIALDEGLDPIPKCRVRHAAGNYSVSRKHGFGSLALDQVFQIKSVRSRLADTSVSLRRNSRRLADRLRRGKDHEG